MFGKLRIVIQTTTRALGYVGMAFIVPMMLLTTADATGRDLLSRPVPGAFELSSFMLSVFVLLGLAYTQQMKGHVRVTILTERLPAKWSDAINIFTTLLSMFIVAIMCWQGIVVAFEASAVSDMLRVPQLPFRLLVTVGGLFSVSGILLRPRGPHSEVHRMMADPIIVGMLGRLVRIRAHIPWHAHSLRDDVRGVCGLGRSVVF